MISYLEQTVKDNKIIIIYWCARLIKMQCNTMRLYENEHEDVNADEFHFHQFHPSDPSNFLLGKLCSRRGVSVTMGLPKVMLGLTSVFWIVVVLGVVGSAEESCSWKADGSKVCTDDIDIDEDIHNVWTEFPEHEEGDDENAPRTHSGGGVTSSDFNELELELFVQFYTLLGDWTPNESSLGNYRPEKVIAAIIDSFNAFDRNDDGTLEYSEMATVLKQYEVRVELSKVQDAFETFEGGMIPIIEYFQIFKKIGDGKHTVPLLAPFDKMRSMLPAGAKKIIQGSVQMFLESDFDNDGRLDKEEFADGMRRSQEKRGVDVEIAQEQIDTLFELIDKNTDDSLTYAEFQATIPDPPKSIDEVMNQAFKETDANSDGFISEEEFQAHMKMRSASLKGPAPTEEAVTDGFHKLDINEDGLLSPEEMKRLFDELQNTQEKRIVEAFNSFDADSDGLLDPIELQKIVKGIEQASGQKLDVDMFLSMLDKDRDGKVSLEEMKVVLSQMVSDATK